MLQIKTETKGREQCGTRVLSYRENKGRQSWSRAPVAVNQKRVLLSLLHILGTEVKSQLSARGSFPGSFFSLPKYAPFFSPHSCPYASFSFLQVYSRVSSMHPLVCSTNFKHNGDSPPRSFSSLISVSDLTTFSFHIRHLECVNLADHELSASPGLRMPPDSTYNL